MAVTRAFWDAFAHPLYHGTTAERVPSILRDGLSPDQPGRWAEHDPLTPRTGHVYMTSDIEAAKRHHGLRELRESTVVLAINPRALTPHLVNPDEDDIPHDLRRQHLAQCSSLGELADVLGWGDDPEETERLLLKDHGLGPHPAISYRGVIPPAATSVAFDPGALLEPDRHTGAA